MKYINNAAFKVSAVILSTWAVFCPVAYSQTEHHESHGIHEPGGKEIGLSAGYVYLKDEKENGVSLHLHMMKRLSGEGLQKYFSVGFGVETILSEEEHYATMVSLAVHPWRNLVLTVSPGYEWAKHEGEWESQYATHLEAVYVFEGSGFHYGPVIGYSKTKDEEHYSVGIHFAMPF